MSRLLTAGILQQAKNLRRNALRFDGVDDYCLISNPIIQSYPFTIESILEVNEEGLFGSSVSISNNNVTLYNYIVCQISEQNIVRVIIRDDDSPSPQVNDVNESFNPGNLLFCSFVFTDTEIKIFIDGDIKGTFANTMNFPVGLNEFNLGRLNRSGTIYDFYYEGIISKTRIWGTERTAQQIQDNVNTILTGNESGLLWAGDFSIGSGNILPDKTSNNNDGTINGATWVEL